MLNNKTHFKDLIIIFKTSMNFELQPGARCACECYGKTHFQKSFSVELWVWLKGNSEL